MRALLMLALLACSMSANAGFWDDVLSHFKPTPSIVNR